MDATLKQFLTPSKSEKGKRRPYIFYFRVIYRQVTSHYAKECTVVDDYRHEASEF
jgi:hypothetical protein